MRRKVKNKGSLEILNITGSFYLVGEVRTIYYPLEF